MDSDSSSYEDRLRDCEGADKICKKSACIAKCHNNQESIFTNKYSFATANNPVKISEPSRAMKIIEKSLSSQVMEYYHQYSQSSNLERYLSRPSSGVEGYEYRWSSRDEVIPRKPCTSMFENTSVLSELPRERRKWTRPPLIGQQSGSSGQSTLPTLYSQGPTTEPEGIFNAGNSARDSEKVIVDTVNALDPANTDTIERETKTASPSTSEASHKPLEWDSGADVGYNNAQTQKSLFERMVFTRGICSTIQRTDPEGTTGSNVDTIGGNTNFKSPSRHSRHSKPNANSTPFRNDNSESDGEIQITPIVKTNLPGIITGNIVVDDEYYLKSQFSRMNVKHKKVLPTKSKDSSSSEAQDQEKNPSQSSEGTELSIKKSTSMHVIALPPPPPPPLPLMKPLKRSQSELNLRGVNFEFVSTSSIATIINKPVTCDRNIQTNLIEEACERESKGIQVSPSVENSPKLEIILSELPETSSTGTVIKTREIAMGLCENEDIEKPELPKRVNSLIEKIPQSILKNSDKLNEVERAPEQTETSEVETEGGRASNSFEYFPGDIYESASQVQGGSTSHVSSIDTGRSHSTMPNTSSSLDEKLWGDSNNLRRDLERSLNVLKSLVDANKCDKQVKKRLIHHVIKRLMTAKYTDDKIEHNLEENVPWNPDDTRNKVYRTEIIQALANKQKNHQSTEDSSEDWKPRKKLGSLGKRPQENPRNLKGIMDLPTSDNSDIFEERNNTDRTDAMQDGRKARMGLRNDDRHCRSYRPHQGNLADADKSESSECFLPQSKRKTVNNATGMSDKSSSITRSSQDLADCQTQERRRLRNDNDADWRLPTTISERRFNHERTGPRLGTATQLIDYVEMEKKNQLVWINSEINHLSNLKKLLEASKKREEGESKRLSGESFDRKTMNDQWSSHGNIAEKCDRICRIKTRNSCTQTNGNDGYSKSAMTETTSVLRGHARSVSRAFSNACVQTLTPQSSRPPSPWSPGRCCLQHANKGSNCHCQRPRTPSPDNARRGAAPVDSKKEAKNRINDKCKTEFVFRGHCEDSKKHCRSCLCSQSENQSSRTVGDHSERSEDKGESERTQKYEEIRCCKVCGTSYSNEYRKCQCTQTYMKPIAYELSFMEKGKTRSASPQSKRTSKISSTSSLESCKNDRCACTPVQPQLKDYLVKNKPEFVDNVETRKRYMSEISQLRQLKKEKRMQLLAVASPSSLITSPKPIKRPVKCAKKISEEAMKTRLRLRYLRLNEVRNKRRQQEKEEQSRKNHLMAKIFCKKLQQKVLEGQVDLSQSVSVISNL